MESSRLIIEMFNWLTVLSGSSGVSKNNDYDIWLTSCTEGASDISRLMTETFD